MLGLALREEFRGKRLKGTTVDFTNQSKNGALEVPSQEFLRITYPSFDLLKTIDAINPEQSRPVVLMGSRGQGKSHLLAALYHLCSDTNARKAWQAEWSNQLGPGIASLQIRQNCKVIAESLHLQKYKFLWDILFENHPKGQKFLGKWEGLGDKKTDVPSYELMVDLFKEQPTILILDEYQTWFEGLTNSKQYPWRNWAFNFIQILSEIAQKHPELLVLVVSVRDGNSDAYQQIHRVNPVLVDFKGPLAKRDRQRLLLYRIFENRMQVPKAQIENAIQVHTREYFRLTKSSQVAQADQATEFLESWPFAPHLLKLLDDQVLVATDSQETRDLIKILVDLFKMVDENQPIITAADFSLMNEKGGVVSLLDSVANQLHKDLREKAIRNLEAVRNAVPNFVKEAPNLDKIVSALWLRSLTVDKLVGADPTELQIDITHKQTIDDNQFQAELATIEENSFNIHRIGNRFVFKNEENPQAKLLTYAKNDKLFQSGEDVEHLAKEVRSVIGGSESVSQIYRVIVLKKKWNSNPWSEFDEKDHPKNWDGRLTVVIVPESPERLTLLGCWLKTHLQENRNTIRFLLLQKGNPNIFYDRELLVLARAVYLAMDWKKSEPIYAELQKKFQNELMTKLRNRFDRFALLQEWNFADPSKCCFEERIHGVQGDKIPEAIDSIIKKELFIPEDFEEYVDTLAQESESVGKLLKELREPRLGGKPCIPWLGEIEVKERVIRMCTQGKISINVRGMEMVQARSEETAEDAWQRMKGKLGTGKHLDETTLQKPDSIVTSGGKTVTSGTQTGQGVASGSTGGCGTTITGGGLETSSGGLNGSDNGQATGRIENLFGGGGSSVTRTSHTTLPTSGLNLLGSVESWGIGPATPVANISLKIPKMTGSQLQQLLKQLPDGITYGLDLEKEAN